MDPQHLILPSSLTPQVCSYPALTDRNMPSGGVAWPAKDPYSFSLEPQHSTVPSSLTPHV